MEQYFNHCFVLVGLPGSGKSTFSKKYDMRVESSDSIIETAAAVKKKTYDEVFKEEIDLASALFRENVIQNARCALDMIIDRTNLTPRSRKDIMKLINRNCAKGSSYIFTAVVFKITDEVEWNRRLNSRVGKTIPKDVIVSMKNNFIMPTLEEGFKTIITYDMFENEIEWIEK